VQNTTGERQENKRQKTQRENKYKGGHPNRQIKMEKLIQPTQTMELLCI
jgi:hypothetical protein